MTHLYPRSVKSLRPAQIVFYADSLILLVQLTLFSNSVYRLLGGNQQTKRVKMALKYANLLCHLFIILYTLMDILHALGSLISSSGYVVTRSWVFLAELSADVLYYWESLAVYSVLMYRLKLIFNNTQFELKLRHFLIVAFIVSLQTLIVVIYLWTLEFGMNYNRDASDKTRRNIDGTYEPVLGCFITALGWILNIYLVWLMTSKLRAFAVENAIVNGLSQHILFHGHCDYNNNGNNNNHKESTSNSARGMIFLVTKQSILGSLLALISQLFFSLQLIMLCLPKTRFYFCIGHIIIYTGRGIEGVFTQILLDLSFGYSSDLYLRLFGNMHHYLNERNLQRMRQRIHDGIQARLLSSDEFIICGHNNSDETGSSAGSSSNLSSLTEYNQCLMDFGEYYQTLDPEILQRSVSSSYLITGNNTRINQ